MKPAPNTPADEPPHSTAAPNYLDREASLAGKLVALLLVCFNILVACDNEPTAASYGTPMSENRFWELIEQAKGMGGDIEHAKRLSNSLKRMPPQHVVDFYVFYLRFHQAANIGDLWAAGMLVNGGHGTDDGFEYFRNWLIGQGRDIYSRALADPDSLAEAPSSPSVSEPDAEWESYGAAAHEAFKDMTGKDLYAVVKQVDHQDKSVRAFDTRAYNDEALAERLPRLWAKYGETKKKFDLVRSAPSGSMDSADVAGLGVVSVGDYLTHRELGACKVKALFRDGPLVRAVLVFPDVERHMVLSGGYADLWSIGSQ